MCHSFSTRPYPVYFIDIFAVTIKRGIPPFFFSIETPGHMTIRRVISPTLVQPRDFIGTVLLREEYTSEKMDLQRDV